MDFILWEPLHSCPVGAYSYQISTPPERASALTIDKGVAVEYTELMLLGGDVTHGRKFGDFHGSGKLPSDEVHTARSGKGCGYCACRRRDWFPSRILEGGVVHAHCEEPESRSCGEGLALPAWGVALLAVLGCSVALLVAPCSIVCSLTLHHLVSSWFFS